MLQTIIHTLKFKVELEVKHQKNLYDGRIFKKEELTVYCYWDIDSQVPRESISKTVIHP